MPHPPTHTCPSLVRFEACARNFSTAACALSFESLLRENEEVFYHCDQLIKGMYSVFYPRWRCARPSALAPRIVVESLLPRPRFGSQPPA